MVISTKYAIDEEVYVIYKENGAVHLFKDKVKEILIGKDKQIYYLEKHDVDEYIEDELIKTYSTTNLIDKIKELTGGQN